MHDPYAEVDEVEIDEAVPDELTHYMRSTGRLRRENEDLRELVFVLYHSHFESELRGNRGYALASDDPDRVNAMDFEPKSADLLREILATWKP